jgi:NitT/TauT family transport system permease protein
MIRDLVMFRGRAPPTVEAAIGVFAAVVLVAVWEVAARGGWVAPQFLPSPSRVVQALWRMTTAEGLLWHAAISTLRVWAAFLLAAAMAIPIGILMSSYRIVGAALEPTIDFIRYLPVPALVPLSIIWFGVGETPRSSCYGSAPSSSSCYWWLTTCGGCLTNMWKSHSRLVPSHVACSPM